MAINTIIDQSQLRGSADDNFLQRVATVFVDGEEYRVLAPARAVGDALEWVGQFRVHQPSHESFNSEHVVEGSERILAIKLAKEALEKNKESSSKKPNVSAREESRRTRLLEVLDELSTLRLCGPSDDPDEQTSVIESYRYLLIQVKTLSRHLVPSEISEQVDAVPSKLESIYDIYESKAHLDAVSVDIKAELEQPTVGISSPATKGLLISPRVIDDLSKLVPGTFDGTKLAGYCKEINSSFYHGNIVACLLLMRTVLNHVPPVFGHRTFTEVTANAGKSLKDNLEHLESGLRKLADLYAHQPIKSKEQYPTKTQVEPFRAQFELLLQEVLNKLQ